LKKRDEFILSFSREESKNNSKLDESVRKSNQSVRKYENPVVKSMNSTVVEGEQDWDMLKKVAAKRDTFYEIENTEEKAPTDWISITPETFK